MAKMYLTMTTIFLRKYLRNIVIVKVEIFLRQMRILTGELRISPNYSRKYSPGGKRNSHTLVWPKYTHQNTGRISKLAGHPPTPSFLLTLSISLFHTFYCACVRKNSRNYCKLSGVPPPPPPTSRDDRAFPPSPPPPLPTSRDESRDSTPTSRDDRTSTTRYGIIRAGTTDDRRAGPPYFSCRAGPSAEPGRPTSRAFKIPPGRANSRVGSSRVG
jgi:hypothetical protein